jgi:hypothetical protein
LQILKNDGEGTPITAKVASTSITAGPGTASSTSERAPSLTNPDAFVPVISHDPQIYNDSYFLAFSTTDKGSGIDHYEVLEVPVSGSASKLGFQSAWRVAVSPYLLQDQSLSSDIYVRAVNHAGNFIVVKLPAEQPAGNYAVWPFGIWLVVTICLTLGLAILLIKRFRKKSKI